MPLERFLGKKYKLKSSENFEDYLKFLEIGLISRKAAIAVSPVACLTFDGEYYTFTLGTHFRTTKIVFKLGEEFIEERADGVKVKSTIVVEAADDGENMIQTQIEDNGRKSTHVRKFTDTTLTVITTAEGWCGQVVRVYESVE